MADIWRTVVRIALFFMSGCLVIWALAPSIRTIAAGLLLGVVVSLLSAMLLRRRVESIGESAATGNRKASPGLASRLAMVLLGAMTAYRFPGLFNLPSTLAASFLIQLAIPLVAYINNKRQDL